MTLEHWIKVARDAGASDLHLEAGVPAMVRVRGSLKPVAEPIAAQDLKALVREVIGDAWSVLLEKGSYDLARVISGVRCRINALHTLRGFGLAVRLLAPFSATLKRLNLHPSLRQLVERRNGLVLVTGATGSGKSTTLAALIQEINLSEARHIITLESPIEYVLTPRQSLIRQREVGRHTPSFAQALIDAMREDPDVLMVGEMRDPETMRLTLNAAETGHLVLATMHSSTCAEAIQRIVSAFPSEVQASISAQLADCLSGVVCQRLRFREDLNLLIPECEVLMSSSAMKGVLRLGQIFKLGTVMDGGGADGSFSFERYREWLNTKTDWVAPSEHPEPQPADPGTSEPVPSPRTPAKPKVQNTPAHKPDSASKQPEAVLEIEDAEDPADILAELDGN